MRKCKGFYYENGKSIDFEVGYFHQFGCDYEEFENGAGNFPVAIVELPDGKVVTPMAINIQFFGGRRGMNNALKMKDITSYSQKEVKKTPRILEFDACGIKFRIHRHIYYPGTWLLTCEKFGIEHKNLDTDDMEEAIHNAKVYMIGYLDGMRLQIDSARKAILESEDCL